MKAVIQTVKDASCTVEGRVTGAIKEGLLIYFGVEKGDRKEWLEPFLDKILRLRIYRDENERSNLSIVDKKGEILIISQFTLAADLNRGNRPSFDNAEKPDLALEFYNEAIKFLREKGIKTEVGEFGAHMEIRYMNDGPETFCLSSEFISRKFDKR